MLSSQSFVFGSFLITFLAVSEIRDAQACGGCFHPEPVAAGTSEIASVVTDHRMVFKISKTETILWDQVRYTGSPEEFAWVLPVRAGAKVELSRDAWIAALDATTKTTVTGPVRNCGSSFSGGGGGGSGGCGVLTSTSSLDNATAGSSAPQDAGFQGNSQVSVVGQSVIGPYQAVTIRANNSEGIVDWLVANKFAIPNEVRPVIEAYTDEQFDFIALRLRPGQGVQAMRPVRVVTQGADATLPLRMVAAGVGAKVGLTLWVVGEGRYETQNFPSAQVDESKITWDGRASRSNFTDLESALLAQDGNRTWVTQSARNTNPNAVVSSGLFDPSGNGQLTLAGAYQSACIARPVERVPCSETDLPPHDGRPGDEEPDLSLDGGTSSPADAGGDGGERDGGDAGNSHPDGGTGPGCFKYVSGCEGFDDLDVAKRGINTNDFWVTRLRADLPVSALSADLRLRASAQVEINSAHTTDKFSDPTFDPCPPTSNRAGSSGDSDDGGCACRITAPLGNSMSTWMVLGVGAAVILRKARRRRR